jgi:flagellar P-ring protein precursor FlgI
VLTAGQNLPPGPKARALTFRRSDFTRLFRGAPWHEIGIGLDRHIRGWSMLRLLAQVAVLSVIFLVGCDQAYANSRIKDIVDVEGVRKNQLVGYGLVVGLNGSGDTLRNIPFTKQSLEAMLERMGVNTRDADSTINTKNVAAVMVTAELPAFAASGSRVDVTVSALGDAKSLLGGTLLVTPLMGADGQTYVVAQGTVQTGAVSAQGASGSAIIKGVPTAGRIASGGVVEREVPFVLDKLQQVRLTLRNPDFTTAERIADAVNKKYPGSAAPENPTIVDLKPPSGTDVVGFITSVEQLPIEVDAPAKVVIDEVNGVVVMGENVRVSTVAIAQGNLTISIQENPVVSQPAPFSQGQTTTVPRSGVQVDEEKGKKLIVLQSGASLASLVKGLNSLGVSPRDMISILQAIKASGALQADIEVM